jgi:hypothetical protein
MMRGAVTCWLAVLLFALLLIPIRGYVIDDTFIHLQFAKHVRDGHGLVFNLGDPVPGSTSPLWSLLLGWLGRFGADLLRLAKTLSVAFGFVALALFFAAATRLLLRPPHALAATAVWAANAWMVRWTPTGMETSLAVTLVLAGWVIGNHGGRAPARSTRFFAGFCFGLATLARPEASLLAAGYAAASFCWPDGRIGPAPLSRRFPAAVAAALGAAVALVPYAIYAWSTYGALLPNTMAAKAAGGMGPAVALERLVQSAKIVGAVVAVEVLALVVLLLPRLGALLRQGDCALHVAVLTWLALVPAGYAIGGLPVLSRYLLPLLPFIVLYAWWAIEHVRLSGEQRWREWVPAAALAASLVLNAGVYRMQVVPHVHAFTAGLEASLVPWGRWLGANAAPDAVVATPDIGAVAYYSDRRILDLGGLVSRPVVPLMRRMPYDEMVRTLAFREAGRPEYLIDRGQGTERLLQESRYAVALTPLLRARTESLAMAKPGAVDYTLYRIDWARVEAIDGAADSLDAAANSLGAGSLNEAARR